MGGHSSLPDIPSFLDTKVHYFGDYELIEELGRGGMGVVYKARQSSLNRIVAVKMMRPGLLSSEADVQRFHVEAEAAASLQHPNIVSIHEVGEHDGLCYFSMDFIAGQSLAEIIRKEPLTARQAAGYVKTIAEAVHHAHERGLLHRDLKPANVIIDLADRPRITDFGLARRIEGDSRLTQTGAVLGTPSYMPPEQAAGRSEDLGPSTDVYSLGAILYELLCGRPPFQAESPVDTLLLVLRAEAVAPRLLNPNLHRDLETICLKCLEKDGRRRYASAQDLADDLERFIADQPIRARRTGFADRGWRWCRRNPWRAIALGGLTLFALLATFSAINWRDRVWHSLVEQAHSERLAGNRDRSLQLLAEAARMKISDDLNQEATQTIVTSGVRLRQAVPSSQAQRMVLNPGSVLPQTREGKFLKVISGDGKTVAMVDTTDPHTIRLYDTTQPVMQERTIELAANIQLELKEKDQISLSPDGSFLAAFGGVGSIGYVWVWDTHTGTQVGMLRGNNSPNWSHDGMLLITLGPGIADTGGLLSTNGVNGVGYADKFVNTWDVFGAPPVYLLKETIYSLAFDPDERQLLSNGVTWDVVKARDSIELRPTAQTAPADSVALAAVDQLWARHTGEKDILMRLWKLAPDRREIVLEAPDYSAFRADLKGHLSASPWKVAISPDGRLLTTVSTVDEFIIGQYSHSTGDVVVELWDLEKKMRVAILNEEWPLATGSGADISADSRLIATASRGGVKGISIRDLFSGKEIRLIQSPAASFALLKFSPDGNLLFAADSWSREEDGGRIFAYEVATGRRVGEWKGHRLGVESLAMTADGAMLAAGGNDRVICLWNIRTGRKLASWEAHQAGVSALAITRDGRTLVSGGTDGALKLWDLSLIRNELSSLGLGW